jgi:hypothetical protein
MLVVNSLGEIILGRVRALDRDVPILISHYQPPGPVDLQSGSLRARRLAFCFRIGESDA